jgi:hypothetical protein
MRDILPPITREPTVSRFALAAALLVTAVGAWLSQGILAFTGIGDSRIALLPLSISSALIAAGAAAAVWVASRAGASLAPLWLLSLLALPWISSSAPPALLIWSGPLALIVWAAIGLSLALPALQASRALRDLRVVRMMTARPVVAAGLLAGAIYAIAAWEVSPLVPAGDEPHYLIITQSLLKDHDLRIENNHTDGDYRSFFAGELPKPDYRRRGRNGEIYSIHAPGLPAIVAPAFAIAGYHGVVVFLIALASIGSALAWHLAWLVTRRADAAWFGWAAVTLSTSGIFHGFAVYPDGPGGVLTLTGVWALVRAQREMETGEEGLGPWWLHGAALAILPWIHSRFAVIAGTLGAVVILRLSTTRNPAGKAVAFLTIPAISAVCWIGFFIAIYGTPDPSAPYANEQSSASFIPGGLAGLLFDQRFGLLAYAPVLAVGFAGLAMMVKQRRWRRLGLELSFVLVPYLIAVTHFAMWWGGHSAPARFFVPMLPMLAIPCAAGWIGIRHRATRASVLAALALTGFISAALVFVDDGRLAFNVRETYAVLPEWLNSATDLAFGMPAWWRGSETLLYRDTAIWLGAFAAAWLGLRAAERTAWLRGRGRLGAATAAAYAAVAMAGLTIVWTLAGVDGRNTTPGQLALLRRLGAEPHALTFFLPDLHRLAAAEVPPLLRMDLRPSTAPGGAGPNDRPLYQIPSVPAGHYRLRPRGAGASGWLLIGIGRDQFSLRSGPIAAPPELIDFDFPVDVRAIVVRGDEQARRTIRGLTIEPVSIVPAAARLADEYALRAVRYGNTTVFFLDERSFPEPDAFWVGGKRSATAVVVQPDGARPTVPVLLRNAPVANRVLIQSGTWRVDLALEPGEERRVALPIDPQRGASLFTISAAAGFRPAAVDPNNRDVRFLGVWIKVLE